MQATATTLQSNLLSNISFKSFKLKTKQQGLLIRVTILCLVFSVLRYESMIHEFDPYFNYRTTLVLSQKGFYEFWNCFDSESWYPLGRIIGGTLYPGLMVTAAIIYWVLRFLRFAVHIREVCALTAPFFGSNTALVAYFFGKEIWDSGAGLVAAALIAICPGYISRSVAGSYGKEGDAIFAIREGCEHWVSCMVFGFGFWLLLHGIGLGGLRVYN